MFVQWNIMTFIILCLCWCLDITDNDIMNLNLPTGIPFEYTLDENCQPLVSMKFLGDEETVKKAMDTVAAQGKAK